MSFDQLADSCFEVILHHLSLRDISKLSRTSRVMNARIQKSSYWKVIFLKTFGNDYWGECVGLHPYTYPLEIEENIFTKMSAEEVINSFIQRVVNKGHSLGKKGIRQEIVY
jgi:hypothetical protein